MEFFFRIAAAANLSVQGIRDNAKWFALAFFAGGRLIAVLANYQSYLKQPIRMVIFWDGQFSFIGAALGSFSQGELTLGSTVEGFNKPKLLCPIHTQIIRSECSNVLPVRRWLLLMYAKMNADCSLKLNVSAAI
jgi:hypothetical protein